MKITHVIHCCSAGGAEILVKNLLKDMKNNFPQNEFELWVVYRAKVLYNNEFSINFEKRFIDELNSVGINVKFIEKKKGKFSKIKTIRRIRELYKENKPDIIHCHLESVTFHVVNSLFFKNVTIVETIHNIKLNRPYLHKMYLNYRVNKYIAISNNVLKMMNTNLNIKLEKINLIYNGIKVDSIKAKEGLRKEVRNLVAIGRLTKQKDHLTLLKAFKLLKEKCIKYNEAIPFLDIYGDGDEKEKLLDYINKNSLKEVNLRGVSNDISTILYENDIYIMSSIYEGLSLSLIEASVSGIPIICTNVGSNKEVVEHYKNGLIISALDENDLAAALYNLCKNYDLRSKFHTESLKSRDKFDINKCSIKHMKVYEEIYEK